MNAIAIAKLKRRLERSVRALDDAPSAPGWNHADMAAMIGTSPRRNAAVLIALIDRADALSVLFTRRNEQLSQHAGQVSFPGGSVEANDADIVAAALRETHEETGIDSSLIVPFGFLDVFETISNFCVTPVMAWLDPAYSAVPDPSEVAEVFEVPLTFLLDPANRHAVRMRHAGFERDIYEYQYAGQRIWGATAAMLSNLMQRMQGAA